MSHWDRNATFESTSDVIRRGKPVGSEFWLRSFWLHGTHRTGDQHNKKVALANQTRRSYRISQARNLCGDYQIIMDYTANINELSNSLNWDSHRTIIYQFYQDFHLQYTHVSPSLSLSVSISLSRVFVCWICAICTLHQVQTSLIFRKGLLAPCILSMKTSARGKDCFDGTACAYENLYYKY